MTKKHWYLIQKINRYWNRNIKYTSDQEQYGAPEVWTFPASGRGDCEDYCIAKRRDLKKHNIQSSFATCWTEDNQYHAVLIIRSTIGDLVLDNRHKNILCYSALPYKWDRIEGVDGKWYNFR